MKHPRIISFANNKGGVGKTTTVATVGSILAQRGYDVLVIDLDGSANLTYWLCKESPQYFIYDSMTSDKSLPVVHISDHLDLVPSSDKLYGIEQALSQEFSRERIFSEKLEDVKDSYDYILIDCSPFIGLMIVSAFTASRDVIILLEPEAMPIQGLSTIRRYLDVVRRRLNDSVRLTGVLLTLYQKITLHKTCQETLEKAMGSVIFNTKIRKNCSLSEASLEHKSILDYAPRSNGAKDYISFTDELLARLNAAEV